MAKARAHIAGIGTTSGASQGKASISTLVSAATKALLDAGVTYDNVTHAIRPRSLKEGGKAFDAFGDEGVSVDEAIDGCELQDAAKLVTEKGGKCVLVVAANKSHVIAFVLVSGDFLARWPFLKDSSIAISGSGGDGNDGLKECCEAVWRLRGWSKDGDNAQDKLQVQGFELSRSDEKEIPKWQDVKHRQDGRHRLGYNPAQESRDVYQEEFEAVKATPSRKKRKSDGSQFKREGGDRAVLQRQQKHVAAKL